MAAIVDTRYWNNDLTPKNNGMDLTGIGTAIGGIAGAIGTGIAANKNLKAVRETNEANLQLARELNDWNLGLWYRENQYNSPSAKLGRLKEAGMNPLFYGLDGVSNAGLLTSAPLANQLAPQMDVGAIGSSLNSLTSSLYNAALIKIAEKLIANESRRLDLIDQLQRAQYPEIEANTRKASNAANLLEQLTETEKKIQLKYDKEIDYLVAQRKVSEELAALLKAQSALAAENTRLLVEYLKTEKSKLILNYALTGKANSESKKLEAETKTIDATRDEQVRKLAAEADCSENDAKRIIEDIARILAETDYKKLQEAYLKVLTELEEKYGDFERVAKILALGSTAVKNIIGAVTDVIPLTAVAKTAANAAKAAKAKGKGKGKAPYKGQFNFGSGTSHKNPDVDWSTAKTVDTSNIDWAALGME